MQSRALGLIIACALAATTAAFAQEKIVVGVLPTFDGSGDDYGEQLTQNMTYMIFSELQSGQFKSGDFQPILLNPGGLYNPIDIPSITDYASLLGVDAVIITTLQQTQKPKSGPWTIKAESQVLDLKSGQTSQTAVHTYSLNRKDVKQETFSFSWFGLGASRPFEKHSQLPIRSVDGATGVFLICTLRNSLRSDQSTRTGQSDSTV